MIPTLELTRPNETRTIARTGTAYIAKQAKVTSLDPPLVAAAYNAGRLKHQDGKENRWKLRQFPICTGHHCDRFVQFLNDAVAVLGTHPKAPAMTIADVLDGAAPPKSSPPPAASSSKKGPRMQLQVGSKEEIIGPKPQDGPAPVIGQKVKLTAVVEKTDGSPMGADKPLSLNISDSSLNYTSSGKTDSNGKMEIEIKRQGANYDPAVPVRAMVRVSFGLVSSSVGITL